jgi:hypothetical protein
VNRRNGRCRWARRSRRQLGSRLQRAPAGEHGDARDPARRRDSSLFFGVGVGFG